MDVECPYCGETVGVSGLERHVRLLDDEPHGAHGSVPEEWMDNPWHLRLDVSEAPADGDADAGGPTVADVVAEARRGYCPACERGVLGLKGGDGLFSRGRRRLACPDCGWESPEWVKVRE